MSHRPMMPVARRAGLALAMLSLVTPWAGAGAETARPFAVSARIVAGCSIAADAAGRWGAIDLGTVSGAAAGTTAQGALVSTVGAGIAIECTPGLSATLSADTGDHPDGGGGRRLMLSGGTATIGYILYADGATTPWTAALPLSFGTGQRLLPVRAVATLAGPAPAGRYTDTIRVTLSW